jgi:hypothetical protein|mmetsp:Transcript_25630/g.41105  ORF Transcript_25630/g.41105 Transcript_25630/m.41105 type:complete len:566 (-) Transcript_25630:176-1873(-)
MVEVEDDNPFKLPPDDQIFLIREQERQKRVEERERVKQLRVWEKTTASSRVQKTRRVDDTGDEPPLTVQSARSARSARTESIVRDARREKENVADFVEKKRVMFLVQMSLDVKKAEILKLDEKAKQKNEALEKSKQMLDEDVTRFDQFLQNNDQKAHQAMKNAEAQTKEKQDRLQKIKYLKSQLSAVQSETAKHREQREECSKYKGFLEKLTPQEWKDEQLHKKRMRQDARFRSWVSRRMAAINSQMQQEMEAEEVAFDERLAEAAKGRRRARRQEEEDARERDRELERKKRAIRRKYPTQDAVEAEYNEVSSGEEMPLCFEEPKQLLDIFTSLEEQNLFLIQTSQDTEQMLEEIQQKLVERKKIMGAQHQKLRESIEELEQQIKEERAQCDMSKLSLSQKRGASEQDKLLHELAEKVMEVHAACGHDTDHDPDTLQMLGAIEAKLEEYLAALDEAEESGQAGLLKTLEQGKERDRREFVRKQRKEATDKKIADRLVTSLQRSQMPIHKKVGKQLMFRSPPLEKTKRVVEEDDGLEEAHWEYARFDVFIDKKDGKPYSHVPRREG